MDFKEYCITSDISYFETIIEAIVAKRIGDVDSALLEPETGKSWRTNNKKKEIENTIIKSKVPKDKIWASFSDHQRLGIYYGAADGSTPLGLYAYPINYVLENGLQVPYGSNRKYILIFEMVSENIVSMKRGQTEISDFDSIRKKLAEDKDFLVSSFKEAFRKKIDASLRFVKSMPLTEPELNNFSDLLQDLRAKIIYGNLEGGYLGIKEKLKILDIPEKSEIIKEIKNFVEKITIRTLGYTGGARSVADLGNLDEENIRLYLSDEAIELIKNAGDRDKQELIDNFGLNWNEENEKESFFDDIEKLIGIGNFYGDYLKIGTPYIEDDKIISHAKLIKKPENFNHISMVSKKIKKSLERSLKEFDSQKREHLKDIHFPLEHQLKQLCDKYKIDWLEILKKTVEEMWHGNKDKISGAFVYKFTKMMSQSIGPAASKKFNGVPWGEKNVRPWALWTKILRELGIDGVADAEGTATIHSGEPTQGAFFNPRQFKLLAVLQNNNFSSDSLNGSWKHPKQVRNQKRSLSDRLRWDADDSPMNRFLKGINKGFSYIESLFDSSGYSLTSPKMSIKFLTKFQILLDSFIKIKNKPDSNQDLKNTETRRIIIDKIMTKINKLSIRIRVNIGEMEQPLVPGIGKVVKLVTGILFDPPGALPRPAGGTAEVTPVTVYYGKIKEKVDDDKYLIVFCNRYGDEYEPPGSKTVNANEIDTSGLSSEQIKKIIGYHHSVINYLMKNGLIKSETSIDSIRKPLKPSKLRQAPGWDHF